VPFRDIYLMRPDGTDKHQLVGGLEAEMPSWSPDGRTIMVHLQPRLRRAWLVAVRRQTGRHRAPLSSLNGSLPDWTGEGTSPG
jgi:Tol biopolymer transport system component